MTVSGSRTVVLYSLPGTLEGIDPLIARSGVRLIRLISLEAQSIPPGVWLPSLERAEKPDTVVVTSRRAVTAGVGPWAKAESPRPAGVEFWAVGPGTALALRQLGFRRVRLPSRVGARAVAEALRVGPARTIIHFRSDHAGSGLARSLRHWGHRVLDVVVYRLTPPPPLTVKARAELSKADVLVVTSPSGLADLNRRLGEARFRRVARGARLVVLGERSRRAARRYGFESVSVAPSTAAQRFTRFLLGEVNYAGT